MTTLGTATLDLRLQTQNFTGQLNAAVNQMRQGLERAAAVTVHIDTAKALADARQLRAELQKELRAALQLDVSAMDLMAGKIQAVTGNLKTVAGELRDAAQKLKETRSGASGSGTGGGSPPASAGDSAADRQAAQNYRATLALNTRLAREAAQAQAAAARQAAQAQAEAVAQLGRQMQVAQSQYQRGALGIREYLREMERVRAAGQTMASGLQAGTREAQALERVMAGFSRNRAAINDQSIVKLRSDLAGARAEFERATAAAGRFNFIGQRQATQAYEQQLRALETRLRSVGERSTATAAQIRNLNQIAAQVGSQRNLLSGQTTGLGISGSVLTALKQLPQFAAQAGGSLGAAAAQATGFGSALSGVGTVAGPAGIAVAAVATAVAGLGTALASTVGPAAQFQQTLVDIKALTQPTAADLAALKQATMDIGTPLGVGARDAAAAVLELNKAGLDAKDAVGGGLAGALTLAGAAGINAAEGSRIAVGAMTAFGLAAEDLPRVADVFANFSNKTFLGAEDLSQALAAVGPVAKSAGLDIEQFAGYMATLAQGGFKNMSDAGTSLKTMLLALQAPSETAAGALKDINLEVYNAAGQMRPMGELLDEMRGKLAGMSEEGRNNALKDIFGTDGIRAATIFMGDYSKSLDENSQRIRDNIEAMGLQGEAARVAQERNESFNGQVRILKATWEQLVITVGEQLLPVLTSLVQGITRALEVFKDLGSRSEELRGYLIPLAGVFLVLKGNVVAAAGVAAWGTLTTAIAGLGTAVAATGTTIAAFVASNPLGALAVVAAGVAMYANKIMADTQSIYDSIDQMEQAGFESLMKKVEELRKAGDAVSLAQAKYLLALDSLQRAQTGTRDMWGNFKTDPKAIELAEKRLAAAKAELEAARAARPVAPLTGQGALLPGQRRAGDLGVGFGSADTVARLRPEFQKLLGQALVEFAAQNPKALVPYIHEGYRSTERQNKLYAQGRTAPGGIVTNAKGGQSLHNYGVAADIYWRDPVTGKVVSFSDPRALEAAKALGKLATAKGLLWGGSPGFGIVDMPHIQENISWQTAAQRYGKAAPPPSVVPSATTAAAAATEKLKKDIAEGHRLIRQYEAAMKSGGEAWITKAHNAIEAFKKGHKEAWGPPLQQALSDAEKAFKKTGTSAAQAAAVSEAQYKKLAPRARELAALEAKAKGKGPQAAEAARQIAQWVKTNGDAAKQVLDYERAALRDGAAAAQRAARERVAAEKKAAQEREAIQRQAAQGQIEAAKNSLERLKIQQGKQLAAVEGNAAAEAKVRLANANQLAAAQKKIAEAQYRADKAAALKLPKANQKQALGNAFTGYQNELRRIETERVQTVKGANKAIADEQTRLNRQLLEGRVEDAQTTLKRMQGVHERELLQFKGTVAQREALVQRQARTEADAKVAIAKAQRKVDEAAARKLPVSEQAAALARIKANFTNALRDIENDRVRAVQNSQQTVKQEEARLQRELLEGRIADANLTVERIQGIHERELLQFKGTLAERQALLERQAGEEAAARRAVAAAQKRLDDDAANKLTGKARTDALRRSETQYTNALREIETNRLRTIQDAGRAVREEQQRIDQQLAEGRVADARLGLEKLKQLHEQELMSFVGTAAQKEVVIRRQADAQLEASKKIAAAQKVIDDTAAGKLTGQLKTDALARSLTTYNNAVRDAQITRDRTVQAAKKATADEVAQNNARQKAASNLERELRQLNERFAQQVSSGKVTQDSLLKYRQALEDAADKAKDLPPALQGGITALLTQGRTLAGTGQQVADYNAEVTKLKDSVDKWAYAELQAGRARVIAAGGDPQKLAILDAEIAKRKTLTDATLEQNSAESRVGATSATLDNVVAEFENRRALAEGNLAELYALEVEYGGNIQYLRDLRARDEAAAEERRIREKYGKLMALEGITDAQLRQLEADRDRDLTANAQRLTNALNQNATARAQAELTAKRNLDAALKTSDRETRQAMLQHVLDSLTRETAALEAQQQAQLDREGITLDETLAVRRQFAPLLLEQKQRELDLTRQMEEAAEQDRYADAVEAARQNGTLLQVQADLLRVHEANMAGIQRRSVDAMRDYRLGVERDVSKAVLALDKQTSDELVENAKGRIDEQLDGLDSMDERQRQVARSALGFWRDVYAAMGATGKAALAEIDAAIARLNQAGQKARTAGGKLIVTDEKGATGDFTRDLLAVGKPDDADTARASAEAGFDGLRETYRTRLADIAAELKQFEGVSDDALSPDERATRDGLLATSMLYNGFLDQIAVRSGEAGQKAADAFTQAQRDAAADAALQLAEINYAAAEAEGRDGSPAYRAGLASALAYWRARKLGLTTGTPEYIAAAQKVAELEGKLREVSAAAIADKEADLRLQQVEAEYALAEAEGKDGSPAYIAGLNAALAYWRARLKTLDEGTPEYIAALQKITDLEKRVSAAQGNPMADRMANLANIVGTNGKFQKGIKAGLDGLAAYFREGGKKGGNKSIIAGADALVTGLGEVFKTGDEDIDSVIDTFVNGIKGTLSALAKGDWIGAIIAGVTTLVMTIVDIFQGGARSAQKAAQQITDATKNIKIFDTSKYATVVARQGFWGWLGFKEAKIDQESLDIAQTFGDAIYTSVSNGLMEGFRAGQVDAAAIAQDLKMNLTTIVVQGLIDGFLKSAGLQAMFQPFLDAYIAAWKAGNKQGMADAINGLDAAMADFEAQINDFATGIEPLTKRLLDPKATTDVTKDAAKDAANDLAAQLRDSIYSGISGGMIAGLRAGKAKFADLSLDVKAMLGEQILQGIITAFLQGEVFKAKLQPLIDQWMSAKPEDRVGIAQQIQAVITDVTSGLASLYENVLIPAADNLGLFNSDNLNKGAKDVTFGGGGGGGSSVQTDNTVTHQSITIMADALTVGSTKFRSAVDAYDTVTTRLGQHVDRFGQHVDRLGQYISAAGGRGTDWRQYNQMRN